MPLLQVRLTKLSDGDILGVTYCHALFCGHRWPAFMVGGSIGPLCCQRCVSVPGSCSRAWMLPRACCVCRHVVLGAHSHPAPMAQAHLAERYREALGGSPADPAALLRPNDRTLFSAQHMATQLLG